MKILVVDDDAVSRRLLESYLTKWEYDVSIAENGTKGWEMFREGEYPIVISDWMMPGMDGPDLIRRIRASAGSGSSYVYTILLTAKSKKGDLVAGMDAGADDFVSKPFDHDELHVRLRAGERIVNLERSLREAEKKLRDSQSQ